MMPPDIGVAWQEEAAPDRSRGLLRFEQRGPVGSTRTGEVIKFRCPGCSQTTETRGGPLRKLAICLGLLRCPQCRQERR